MKHPIIGLGTAAIGRPQYINLKTTTTEAPFHLARFRAKGWELLDQAWGQGIRYFDTAPGYGLAEELLIDWCADKPGNELEIATKWGYTYVANFDPNATVHEIKEHSLAKLNEQWEQSKKLLPYLSTYQIHSATFATGVLENEAVLQRLAELKDSHGLKIGLSTTGPDQLEMLKKALAVEVNGELLFTAFQVTYNLFDQSIASLFRSAAQKGRRFIIKEALANGRVFPNADYPHYQAAYQYLSQLARKYAVGIDAVALRFCQDTLQPFTILSGAAQTDHLLSNLKTATFCLNEQEITTLKSFGTPPEKYWAERKLLGWQ